MVDRTQVWIGCLRPPSFPITMTPKLRYVKVIRRWGPWRWGWNLPRWPRLDFGVVIVVMVWVEISGCDNWKRSTTLACLSRCPITSRWQYDCRVTYRHEVVVGGGGRARTYLQLPLRQWGCQKCLPLSVVQLKGKHCQKPHCRNGVVDTFGHGPFIFQNFVDHHHLE